MFDDMEPPARKPKRESKRKTRYSGADGKPQIELIPRNENQKLYIEALQTDLAEQSGLSKIVHMAKKYGIGRVVEFDDKDIVRSNLCKQWIKAFKSEGL